MLGDDVVKAITLIASVVVTLVILLNQRERE